VTILIICVLTIPQKGSIFSKPNGIYTQAKMNL